MLRRKPLERLLLDLLRGDLLKLRNPQKSMVKLKSGIGTERPIMIGTGIISELERLLQMEMAMAMEMEAAIDFLLERNLPDVR